MLEWMSFFISFDIVHDDFVYLFGMKFYVIKCVPIGVDSVTEGCPKLDIS